ncbi:hypothetical protein N7540_012804 [Penicillium herquei]|nr:hypothetical protein N7540_012804 [Penicillium herquei]
MLLHPVFRILLAVLPLFALCTASSNASNETNAELWDMIPDCARNCTENFIKTNYLSSSCADTDYKCLCRTETVSTLTLGEAAIECAYALCSESIRESTKAYHICDSVSGALSETHSTLTATTFASTLSRTTTDVSATTTESSTSSTTSTTSTSHHAEATSTSESSRTSTSTTESSTKSSQTALITSFHASTISGSGEYPHTISSFMSTSTSTNSSAPTDGSSGSSVSAGTVIGVSVVSGVAGCFIIGVAVFYGAKRWRKNHRVEQDSEVGDDGPSEFPEESLSRETSFDPDPGAGPSASGALPPRQELEVSQVPRQPPVFHPTSQYPPRFATGSGIRLVDSPRDENNQRIGFAVTSESVWGGSPRTVDSQHTLAELPPIRTPGLCPQPLRVSHRPSSGETLFEEDGTQTTIEKKLPDLPSTRGAKSKLPNPTPGLPPNPRALKQGFRASQFRRPANQRKPAPTQPQSPRETPAGPRERKLGPPFSATSSRVRRSIASNSSSGPNYSSESSDHTSNTFATTPPFSTAQVRFVTDQPPTNPQPPASKPPSDPTAPAPNIVSRPRVVRGDDIKRIQPGSSPRPPSEVVVPYCPEDFWLERGRSKGHSRTVSAELPYPSEAFPGRVLYPSSPQRRPGDAPRRVSPSSRNLTPSRRGDDLILSVD